MTPPRSGLFAFSRPMGDRVTVAVDVPLVGDERYKNWAKVVESVDDSRASGWAFKGQWQLGGSRTCRWAPLSSFIGERGSRANPQITARVYTVNPDSTLSLEAEAKEGLGPDTPGPGRALPRSGFDRPLLHQRRVAGTQLRNRGWTVEQPDDPIAFLGGPENLVLDDLPEPEAGPGIYWSR